MMNKKRFYSVGKKIIRTLGKVIFLIVIAIPCYSDQLIKNRSFGVGAGFGYKMMNRSACIIWEANCTYNFFNHFFLGPEVAFNLHNKDCNHRMNIGQYSIIYPKIEPGFFVGYRKKIFNMINPFICVGVKFGHSQEPTIPIYNEWFVKIGEVEQQYDIFSFPIRIGNVLVMKGRCCFEPAFIFEYKNVNIKSKYFKINERRSDFAFGGCIVFRLLFGNK